MAADFYKHYTKRKVISEIICVIYIMGLKKKAQNNSSLAVNELNV